MLTLSIDDIRNYQVCELYYQLDKESGMRPIHTRDILATKYRITLRKVLSFFFYKRQAGITPSYNALLNRWEKLWFPKDMDAYDLAVEQHHYADNIPTYNTHATSSLLAFYNDFLKDDGIPIIIEEEFLTTFFHNDLRIQGMFDLILQYKNHLKVVQWIVNPRLISGQSVLDFAAIKYAFEHRRRGKPSIPIEYYVYDVSQHKRGWKQMKTETADLDALRFWANEIRSSETFIPRRGCTIYCKNCPFDLECQNFEFNRLLTEGVNG